MSKQCVHLFVRGKVQGVFFRQALKVMAIKNNVTGWVRNLDDGRVEALLEGDIDGVNTIVEWTHGGPANSRVDDVEIKNEVFKDEFTDFEVLY
jgi:acylphosphatase